MKHFFYLSFIFLFLSACTTPAQMHKKPLNLPPEKPSVSALPKDASRSIFYHSNEIDVPAVALQFLQNEGLFLKNNPKAVRKIVGYTDDEGTSAYNLAIAQQRIDEIVKILKKHGARAQQLQTYAVGKEKSFCLANKECQRQMRRVDVEVIRY